MARKQKSPAIVVRSKGRRPSIRTLDSFHKELAKLDARVEARVLVKMQLFATDWVSVVSDQELISTWSLKSVSSDERCRKMRLLQINPTDQTRAWLWTDKAIGETFVLFVWHNTDKGEEDRIIKRLCSQLPITEGGE